MSGFLNEVTMPEIKEPEVHASIASHARDPFNSKSDAERFQSYVDHHKLSLTNNDQFWAENAKRFVNWFAPFDKVSGGSLLDGDSSWFNNGKLNVAYNCVDRHVNAGKGDQIAILWEGDEPGTNKEVTYSELQREVCRIANVMTRL